MGVAYVRLGKFDEALGYSNQALKIYKKTGDKAGIANAFLNLGVVYENLGNPNDALRNYEEALK